MTERLRRSTMGFACDGCCSEWILFEGTSPCEQDPDEESHCRCWADDDRAHCECACHGETEESK